jgi:hypothetical protein
MLQPVQAKPAIAKLHSRCHSAFGYSEHICAVLYAVCEFGNLHFFLLFASAGLLVAIFGLAVLVLAEKFL